MLVRLCLVALAMYIQLVSTLIKSPLRTRGVSAAPHLTQLRSTSLSLAAAGLSVPIDVYIDSEIRSYLKIKNQSRKVRFFVPKDKQVDDMTLKLLRQMIETKVEPLVNQPYGLTYRITSTDVYGHNYYNPMARPRPLLTDTDVVGALTQVAKDIEEMASADGGKGSIQLYVDSLESLIKHQSDELAYLKGMPDPNMADKMTFLSFYQFYDIEDTEKMREALFALWKPFKALGRVYVAKEGINGQMAVPSNVLDHFYEACRAQPIFADPSSFFYFNTDHEMTKEEFEAVEPFKALHIRERAQILADGFDEPLDWRQSGTLLDAREWHDELDNPEAVILDCRNSYESDVGTFDGAISLNTTFFRESWDALDEVLKDTPKDRPIMTFCTGGIRCVKINAYLHQKMGYTNVSRLKGGIINYAKQLGDGDMPTSTTSATASAAFASANEEHFELVEGRNGSNTGVLNKKSKFRGVNYVFDERMGAKITDDLFAKCETCGTPCGSYTNCRGNTCHVRFLQCPSCQTGYEGCCSEACRLEAQEQKSTFLPQPGKRGKRLNAGLTPRAARSLTTSTVDNVGGGGSASGESKARATSGRPSAVLNTSRLTSSDDAYTFVDELTEDIMDYCESVSMSETVLAAQLRHETAEKYSNSPGAARMISGHLQGSVLTLLAKMVRAKTILELGSFTGYSALCFAEALRTVEGGAVYSCDIDSEAADVAKRYFDAFNAEEGRDVIHFSLQPAVEALAAARERGTLLDLVFIDADKMQYPVYLRELMGEQDDGSVREDEALLADGALIVIDNTLWKGLVLTFSSPPLRVSPRDPADFGKAERMIKLANHMHMFNKFVHGHPCLEQVVLPVRDGLSILRYSRKGNSLEKLGRGE